MPERGDGRLFVDITERTRFSVKSRSVKILGCTPTQCCTPTRYTPTLRRPLVAPRRLVQVVIQCGQHAGHVARCAGSKYIIDDCSCTQPRKQTRGGAGLGDWVDELHSEHWEIRTRSARETPHRRITAKPRRRQLDLDRHYLIGSTHHAHAALDIARQMMAIDGNGQSEASRALGARAPRTRCPLAGAGARHSALPLAMSRKAIADDRQGMRDHPSPKLRPPSQVDLVEARGRDTLLLPVCCRCLALRPSWQAARKCVFLF